MESIVLNIMTGLVIFMTLLAIVLHYGKKYTDEEVEKKEPTLLKRKHISTFS